MKPKIKHAIKTARGANPAYRALRWILLLVGGALLRSVRKRRNADKNRAS